jgi:uncharacterized membrane protein YqaE (UPF0057 family)
MITGVFIRKKFGKKTFIAALLASVLLFVAGILILAL